MKIAPNIRGRRAAAAALAGAVILAAAALASDALRPRPGAGEGVLRVVGRLGGEPGQFVQPRSIAVDRARGCLYVTDRTGRIQRFSLSGRFERIWRTPETRWGNPRGVAVEPGGAVLVADTHYHRILRYSPDGELLGGWGREGDAPGEFAYPLDVAVAPDGTVYTVEYGALDRVQRFTPEGKPIGEPWGRTGTAPGEFQRPSGVAVGPDGTVYVADAVNHRVQVFTADGELRAIWGGLGSALGRFRYPYDVAVDADGTVYVVEFGGGRVQAFGADGRVRGCWGGPGRELGRLASPWGVEVLEPGRIFVADTRSHRVVLVRMRPEGDR